MVRRMVFAGIILCALVCAGCSSSSKHAATTAATTIPVITGTGPLVNAPAYPLPFHYALTDLGVTPDQPGEFAITGVNSYGQVIGRADYHHFGYFMPFLWTPDTRNGATGTFTDFYTLTGPPYAQSIVGLNDDGQVLLESLQQGLLLWTPTQPNGTRGQVTAILAGSASGGGFGLGASVNLNNYGQVAGQTFNSNVHSAFLWTPTTPNGVAGAITDIGALLHDPESTAFAINGVGQVLGAAYGAQAGVHQTFVWTPDHPNSATGAVTLVKPLPGDTVGDAYLLNDAGQLVGNSSTFPPQNPPMPTRSFLLTPAKARGAGGTYTVFLPPTGYRSLFFETMNNRGDLAGYIATGTAYTNFSGMGGHAVAWKPDNASGSGNLFDIPPLPGDDASIALAIDDSGFVFGLSYQVHVYQSAQPKAHLFIWSTAYGEHDVQTLLVGDPGLTFVDMPQRGVNAGRQILVFAKSAQGQTHLYLLTPQR